MSDSKKADDDDDSDDVKVDGDDRAALADRRSLPRPSPRFHPYLQTSAPSFVPPICPDPAANLFNSPYFHQLQHSMAAARALAASQSRDTFSGFAGHPLSMENPFLEVRPREGGSTDAFLISPGSESPPLSTTPSSHGGHSPVWSEPNNNNQSLDADTIVKDGDRNHVKKFRYSPNLLRSI
jgi:hypothetical protein